MSFKFMEGVNLKKKSLYRFHQILAQSVLKMP